MDRAPERNDSLAGNCLWSATNLSEANPEAQTPLTLSLARHQQAHGGPSMALRGREMAGSIGGRVYANLSVQITARRGKAGKLDPREAYRTLSGWWGDLPDDVPVPLVPMTRQDWAVAGPELLGSLLRLGWTRLRLPAFLRTHQARCAELTARVEACAAPGELHELWHDELCEFGIASFWAIVAAGSESPARLEAQLRERLGDEDASALMSDMSGLAGQLESLGPAAGLQEVRAGRLSRHDYLERFGHRGVNETELAWPRPAEDPDWLDRMLVQAAQRCGHHRPPTGPAPGLRCGARPGGLPGRAARGPRPATARPGCSAGCTAGGGPLRGRAHHQGAAPFRAACRRACSASVRTSSCSPSRNCWPPWPATAAAFELFDVRRETYQRYRALPAMPGVICGRFDPFAWAADPNRRTNVFVAGRPAEAPSARGDDLIVGHPGALGRFEGMVRRIDRFEDADQLRPGEILVTQLTNIGWTPLFPRAGAVVTDLGAPLSHAAIVARELGVPAVVGCGDATARLHTGDRVEVDGARGEVRILASAGANLGTCS